jgi:DNA-binding response OmpR family regulator
MLFRPESMALPEAPAGEPVTLLWKPVREGTAVFAASAAFAEQAWLRRTGESVWLRDETGRSFPASKSRDFVLRRPAETKLPWVVAVAAPGSGDGFAARRDILLLLLAVVALFTLAGGYFVLRALRREFALVRMQSDFVSAVSHEFRTPLTSMRLITEALEDGRVPDPGRLRDSYRSLSRATQRLHRLVEDLLDFRRMESGAIEYRMRPLDAEMDGFDVCRELRKAGVRTPILFLTARTHEAEKVLGLDLGADDYVTKPFSARELRARIRARLRSSQPETEDVLRCAGLEIDTARAEVRKAGGKVEVTSQEFKLLLTFAKNRGRVLSREQLIDLAWGRDTYVTDRAVDAHIVNLRRKLGQELIASVRGMGYRFDG